MRRLEEEIGDEKANLETGGLSGHGGRLEGSIPIIIKRMYPTTPAAGPCPSECTLDTFYRLLQIFLHQVTQFSPKEILFLTVVVVGD